MDKKRPATGDLRQVGKNVECFSGTDWFLIAENTTLFLMTCINAELTPDEVWSQAKLHCPEDPKGFVLKEMETAGWLYETEEEDLPEYLN